VQYIQRIQFGGRYVSSDLPDLDFAKVAEGLGCRGVTVRRPDELEEALADAIRREEPVVLDVKTAIWETPIFAYREAAQREGRRAKYW